MREDRLEIQVAVADVESEKAILFQDSLVEPGRFVGEEMDGHGVAGEGIQDEQV